jgi:hypothetical protein
MIARLAAALAAGVFAAAGCTKKPSEPATAPPPPPLTAWPEGRTAPQKITATLVLAIPLQYERSAVGDDKAPRSPFAGAAGRTEVRFDFFLPDFHGYTLQNYRNEFDENKVEIVYLHAGDSHEADPDAPGEYPPNMLKRLLREFLNPSQYKDMYGLRCYQGRVLTDRLTCYGPRDQALKEDILLYVPVAPEPSPNSFPMLKANYFSQSYGGVRIAWRTHVRNLPRWHDIDAQIWKLVEAWKVAPPAPDSPTIEPPTPEGKLGRRTTARGQREIAGAGQPKLILASRLARESALASASSRAMRPPL